jgi:hypothetical protein
MGVEGVERREESRMAAHGIGPLFQFQDKDYTVTPINKGKLQARWEQWARREAYNQIEQDREFLGERRYKEAFRNTQEAVQAGEYSWGMPRSVAMLNSPKGGKQLALLQLSAAHPEVDSRLIDLIFEDNEDEIATDEATGNVLLDEEGQPRIRRKCALTRLVEAMREANADPTKVLRNGQTKPAASAHPTALAKSS